jgi:hypothetical protein
MATIYKLKQDNGALSNSSYTLMGARQARKRLEDVDIKTKIIVFEERKVIVDTQADITGKVRYYRNPTEQELKQMIKQEQKA